jgi:hypothetical protein
LPGAPVLAHCLQCPLHSVHFCICPRAQVTRDFCVSCHVHSVGLALGAPYSSWNE